MQKTVVKYAITIILLLIYINRGVFITPYEIENHDNKETNSIVEWVMQLITGEDNGIDEDGDLQTDCNFVKIVQHAFSQQISQNFELMNLFSKNLEKTAFSVSGNTLQTGFYTQIDNPPQMV